MKRDRTSLLLMEQLVMLLVFALAAALCLQAFVTANRRSRTMADRDKAAVLCQSVAETLKHKTGDIPATLEDTTGGDVCQREGFGYFVSYGEGWSEFIPDGRKISSYTLRVQPVDSGVPGLGKAHVEACAWERGEMVSLFAIETAWQEVSGHG